MIKGITQNSKHLIVNGGSMSMPYINNYTNQAMVGQLRLNPSTQNIEVYDGNAWLSINASYASIGLSMTAEEAIDWAIKKQQEEKELDELCKKHPALADAYERLQIIKTLIEQGDTDIDTDT